MRVAATALATLLYSISPQAAYATDPHATCVEAVDRSVLGTWQSANAWRTESGELDFMVGEHTASEPSPGVIVIETSGNVWGARFETLNGVRVRTFTGMGARIERTLETLSCTAPNATDGGRYAQIVQIESEGSVQTFEVRLTASRDSFQVAFFEVGASDSFDRLQAIYTHRRAR